MPTLRKKWNRILETSVGLAAMLAMVAGALVMMIIVGIAVVLAKIAVFVR